MNYGKKRTLKREQELVSKSTMIRKKFFVIFCKALLICFFAVVIVGGSAAIGVVSGIIDSAPSIEDIDATPTGYLTTVLDCEGNEIATLVASGSNRKYVTIDEIPEDLQHAFVAIEDERFYEHNGIDIQGIIRAAVKGVAKGFKFSEGASTITQQLLKNTVFTEWVYEESMADKFERKFQEQYLALQLEKIVDKDWILENYLNAINLGQNTLGVGVASERYFGKDVSELTLSECAVLAAITKSPYKYNPISHPENNAERRETVLDYMLEQGYITQAEYDEAMADDVYSRIQVVNVATETSSVDSYFVDELTDQVINDLVTVKGYTETQAYKALYQGGLVIESTQDPTLQAICDEEANNQENFPYEPKISFSYRVSIQSKDKTITHYSEQTMLSYYRSSNKNYNIDFDTEEEAAAAIEQYKADIMQEGDTIVSGSETVTYTLQPQVALTLIDQSTGEVKALVGGRGEKTGNKTLNRATGTTRQPGSTFKIIAAYAAALDAGGKTLADVQDDAPYHYQSGEQKEVSNANGRYMGFTTIREAITNSINIVTVKTHYEIGISLGYEYIRNFGFTTVGVDESANESLSLGGLTKGVTNLELTAAYATIANGGTYIKPKFYTRILDHDGNVLIDNTTSETRTVLKETTAWLLTDAMKDVMTSGTGTAAYFGNGMAQAGKTGTTTDSRDALFVGYTPYYTCAVWGGYDDNISQKNLGTNYPKKIWKAIMSRIHENLEYADFEKPEGIVTAAVCKESGKLAIEGVCDSDPRGSCVIEEYFAEGTVPTEYCDHHIRADICSASGQLVGNYCPYASYQSGVYVIGGTPTTEDAPYLLTDEFLSNPCTFHNAQNSTFQQHYSITLPDFSNLGATGESGNAGGAGE
ncbi:MAG: PBP1A family penicillin-binding protein [Roseburia sp.]|nr:PBP1A family penicillin-binding protein [Roseburia sp.]